MQLNIHRIFSDRVVWDEAAPGNLRVTNSLWDWIKRMISWIWSPAHYTEENRRTVACFKKYLIDTLGAERLQRICNRYHLKLEGPLFSRQVAQIVTGARDVSVEDINEFIQKNPQRFPNKNSFEDLSSLELAQAYKELGDLFPHWKVARVHGSITGRPSESIARFFYDPFLADRERLQICQEHYKDGLETFIQYMAILVIKREMQVGTLIQAPNHTLTDSSQFYYVKAKIVSGNGMVSYIVHPATFDTELPGIRFFRGTSIRTSEIDAISTMITDLERDLGRTAYESGLKYEPILREKRAIPDVEVGHSLGSVVVQYRLANLDHIKTAHLLNGPGIPAKEVEKFNQKSAPVRLVIRQSTKDQWNKAGQIHLGYQAPAHVKVDYLKYHTPQKKPKEFNPHVAVWGKEKMNYGIEGGHKLGQRNIDFYLKSCGKERVRSIFGPPVACILRVLRYGCRTLAPSRTHGERGLKIGSMQNGRWSVEHFNPM